MNRIGNAILIVDDNDTKRYLLQRVIEGAGFRTREARTGAEALKMVRSLKPELVLLDVKLPDISGFEVCRQIRADAAVRDIPILHLSFHERSAEAQAQGLEGGADAFLTQPVEPVVLLATMKALIRSKRAEEALRESEEKYRVLFESNPNPIWVFDVETWKFLAVNKAMVKTYGYTEAELLSMTIAELRSPKELERLRRLEEGSASMDTTGLWTHLRKDGIEFQVSLISHPIRFKGREARLVTGTDMTERIRIEEELRAALLQRDEFLSVVSHEIKNPITSMLLQWESVGLAHENGKLTDEKIAKVIATSLNQGERLSMLLGDLLDVGRIAHNRFRLAKSEFDLAALVAEEVELYQPAAELAGTSLVFSRGPSIRLFADINRVRQVLSNVLSNAVKYGRGRPVEIFARAAGDSAEISVRDHGPGISADSLASIFNRFERVGEQTEKPGLGLGLYIAKQIVDAHGGTLAVESTPGEGSTFLIRLPLQDLVVPVEAHS